MIHVDIDYLLLVSLIISIDYWFILLLSYLVLFFVFFVGTIDRTRIYKTKTNFQTQDKESLTFK